MNLFFKESDAGRLEALLAASEAHPQKLPAYIIEKDLYVTCILQILYLELAPKFTSICPAPFIFKGGTSLSKCHFLINRMSEDIDLSFSMDLFGEKEVQRDPKRGRGKMQEEAEAIDDKARCFVKAELLEPLTAALKSLDERIEVEVENDEPLHIGIRYPSVVEEGRAVLRRVLLETGSLSQNNPVAPVSITHILGDIIEDFKEEPFSVVALNPERTLLEKMFAVHCNLMSDTKKSKYARHLYDILQLHNENNNWCEDKSLMDDLVEFCDIHYRTNKDHCDTARKGPLHLAPKNEEMLRHYTSDWDAMADMFPFGELPYKFDELLKGITALEVHVNKVYY
ncbi:nucleotidyl transferase AbiEii/AbiGii toxin family protein [Aeromonas hydrophila]|uniref:nucleotidyl transferase AbiEii/AbiGii toxin family protein n=1 Tax=Aeromonas hydrophila TaxID=644 RepID=UPI0039873399